MGEEGVDSLDAGSMVVNQVDSESAEGILLPHSHSATAIALSGPLQFTLAPNPRSSSLFSG